MGASDKATADERLIRYIGVARRLIMLNLFCFPIFLPIISWFYLVINAYVGFPVGAGDVLPGIGYVAGLLLRLPSPAFYCLLALSAVLFGPCLLGLHAIVGGMITGRHVWVSEFFMEVRRNMRQGVVLGLSLAALGHLTLWNVFGGLTSDVSWLAFLIVVSRWASVGVFVLFGLALPFVCQIAVSVKQPLWVVGKNGVILARVHLGRGLLVLLGILVYWWVTSITFPVLSLPGLPLLSLALTAFVQAAMSRPMVEKYLLEPMRQQKKS